jgi:phosphoserine phosphatase RsbU/P
MKTKRLGIKLAIYIISATVLIVGLILWRNNTYSKQVLIKNVKENAINLTRATVNKIEGVLVSVSKIPQGATCVMQNFALSPEFLLEYLNMIVKKNPEIFGSCVAFQPYAFNSDSLYYSPFVFRQGDSLACEYLGSVSYQYFYRDWYQIPALLNKELWSEPYYDDGGGNQLLCSYSVPFYKNENDQKILNGIVTVDLSLEWLDELVSSIKLFESGYAFLISQNGTIITHPINKFEMNQTIFSVAEEYGQPQLRNVGRKMLRGEKGFIKYNSVVTKEEGYMYYYPLKTAGWSMAVVFPENELFADLYKLNRRLLLIGIGGVFLLLILIIVISHNITRPLAKLAKVTRDIGHGNFDLVLPDVKSKDEIATLTNSIQVMQKELKTYIANLQSATAAKERIESELKIAHDIQQGIIPKIFPPFPERDDVDLFAILDPARDVGGDLYDFFFLDENRLCFAIGDVSGKGVPASLFMAITRTLLRATMVSNVTVQEAIQSMNNELCQGNENSMFVTFFLGVIDLETGIVTYTNAGHNYPYILRGHCQVEALKKTHGTPLGIFEDMSYGLDQFELSSEDTLVLFTDGVPEACNLEDKLYGDDTLKNFLGAYCKKHPKQITMDIVNSVKDFVGEAQQSDDITLLVLTYFLDKKSKNSRQLVLKNKISELVKLQGFIDDLSQEWTLSVKLAMHINLVLEEVVSNIVFYAYTDEKNHEIKLYIERSDDKLLIRILDDGLAFNPIENIPGVDADKSVEERAIGGLGIPLLNTLMDKVEYERANGQNILKIERKIN